MSGAQPLVGEEKEEEKEYKVHTYCDALLNLQKVSILFLFLCKTCISHW